MDAVLEELAQGAYPSPDDCLETLSPPAALYYTEQMAEACVRHFTEVMARSADAGEEVPEDVGQVLDAIASAAGQLVAACVLLSVLPPEAAEL